MKKIIGGGRWETIRYVTSTPNSEVVLVKSTNEVDTCTYLMKIGMSSGDNAVTLNEAKILNQLSSIAPKSANFPKYKDFVEENGNSLLVMDYKEGVSLANLGRSLNTEEILVILRFVLDVLEFLSGQRVMHLDIHPRNILVNLNEKDFIIEACVIDFGSAKAIGERFSPINDIQGYMAPEHLRGEPYPASDVYALGQVCKNFLHIHPPENQHEKNQFAKINQLLQKMIEPDVSKRYQSATSVKADLHKITATQLAGGSPPEANQTWSDHEVVYPSAPAPIKKRLVFGSILGAFLLGWLVISLFQPRRPISITETPPISKPPQTPPIKAPKISPSPSTQPSETKTPPSETPTPSSTKESPTPKVSSSPSTKVSPKPTKIDERCLSKPFRPVDCP